MLKCYHVDAFSECIFSGNPACVVPLDNWLSDDLMQKIAFENNLSETAFVVKQGNDFALRWFTPTAEIDLCGHATLATAFVLKTQYGLSENTLCFHTLSGILTVQYVNNMYEMNFPQFQLQKIEVSDDLIEALGFVPCEVWLGRDLVCVAENEQKVRDAQPNFAKLSQLNNGLLCHITAHGKIFDCVSRSFAPKIGIDEDPVCGSAHCHIAPLWARRLDKADISAYQASSRGGELLCRMLPDNRMILAGKAVLYSVAELAI